MTELTCQDCGFAGRTLNGLRVHRGWKHRDEYPRLTDDPRFEFLPWHAITVIDRGFDSECWVVPGHQMAGKASKRIVLVRDGVNTTRALVAMHLCERPAVEPNNCVRPEHVVLATMSENMIIAQSNPSTKIKRNTPEWRAKLSAAHLGKPKHTIESRAKLRAIHLGLRHTDAARERMQQSQRARREREGTTRG